MLRKSQFAASQTPAIPDMGGDELALNYPTMWSFLTQTTWEDNSPRQTGSVLLFADGGALKAMVKDKDNEACLWVTAPNLTLLFAVIDSKLTDPTTEWRKDRFTGGMQKRKK